MSLCEVCVFHGLITNAVRSCPTQERDKNVLVDMALPRCVAVLAVGVACHKGRSRVGMCGSARTGGEVGESEVKGGGHYLVASTSITSQLQDHLLVPAPIGPTRWFLLFASGLG